MKNCGYCFSNGCQIFDKEEKYMEKEFFLCSMPFQKWLSECAL